ncbi:hypothetical protein [Chryseobacterium indoltheticum]|uniref:hypothetical protein n=1 Tax=Chryseobacterium indoltheticum TaxID=254 RepID=UPI003F49AA72
MITCVFAHVQNPVVTLLKKDLFGPENLALMTAGLPEKKTEVLQPASVIFTGGIIRPMIDGKAEMVEAIGFAEGQKVVATGSLSLVIAEMDANFKDEYTIRY